MEKREADRLAYHYAIKLLPGYIENLKKQLEEEKDERKKAHLSWIINYSESAMEEINKMYEKMLDK